MELVGTCLMATVNQFFKFCVSIKKNEFQVYIFQLIVVCVKMYVDIRSTFLL